MRFRILAAEAWRSLAANMSTTLAATVTVLIGMFLVGATIGVGTWLLSWSDNVERQLVVNVYFCRALSCPNAGDAKQSEMDKVANQVSQFPEVRNVDFVSREEALDIMEKRTPELVAGLPSNPLPDKLKVTVRNGRDVFVLKQRLTPRPAGVESVEYGGQTARKIVKFVALIGAVVVVAVLLLLLASMLLIANTIRLSIFSRRREIEVMKLVGATNWFVRGPFMLEGLICGVVGAVAAVLLLFVTKTVVVPALPGDVESSSGAEAWPFVLQAGVLLLIGLALGAAGSGLTIRRFLRI